MGKKKMAVVWEKVKTNKWLKDWELYRAKVPGGWLVATKGRPGWGGGTGLTFYPDPEYAWKP